MSPLLVAVIGEAHGADRGRVIELIEELRDESPGTIVVGLVDPAYVRATRGEHDAIVVVALASSDRHDDVLRAAARDAGASYAAYAQLTGNGWVLHPVDLGADVAVSLPVPARVADSWTAAHLDVALGSPTLGWLSQLDADGAVVFADAYQAAVGVRVSDRLRVRFDGRIGLWSAAVGGGVDVLPAGFDRNGPLLGAYVGWRIAPARCPVAREQCIPTRDTPAYHAEFVGVGLPIGWRFPLDREGRRALTLAGTMEVAYGAYRRGTYPDGAGTYVGGVVPWLAFEL